MFKQKLYQWLMPCLLVTLMSSFLLAAPVSIDSIVAGTNNSPPYMLESITVGTYTVLVDKLVTGTSTMIPLAPGDAAAADDFDLNSFVPRNNPSDPWTVTNIDGKPTYRDTNGAAPDFFVFEYAAGNNADASTFRAILPGGALGQGVVIDEPAWNGLGFNRKTAHDGLDGASVTANNGQVLKGAAFSITDLKDENGSFLPADAVIEGIYVDPIGLDVAGFFAYSAGLGQPQLVAPALGEKNIPADTTLQWSYDAGDGVDIHYGNYTLYLTSDPNLSNTSAYLVNGQAVAPASATDPAASLAVSGIDEGSDYYWWVDATVYEPNTTTGIYNIPHTVTGPLWNFSGVVVVPILSDPATVYALPDLEMLNPAEIQPAVFSVDITAGKPIVSIQWLKDGQPYTGGIVTNTPDLASAANTTLTIANPTEADEGNFSVLVQLQGSADNKAESASAPLYVSSEILAHRYSFNQNVGETTVVDSISGADGTIVDPGDTNLDFNGQGELVWTPPLLPDQTYMASSDPNAHFVDLPNHLISSLGNNMTIMVWFTWQDQTQTNWQRLMDFGLSAGGEGVSQSGSGGQDYFMITPKSGGSSLRCEAHLNPHNQVDGPIAPLDQEICLTVVWDSVNDEMKMYLDGQLINTSSGLLDDLTTLNDLNCWLGRSQWPDKLFTGKINELRIYNVPLSAPWVESLWLEGPDDPTPAQSNPCLQPPTYDINGDCMVDAMDLMDMLSASWTDCGLLKCQ